MATNKEQIYRQNMQRSLVEVYTRIETLLNEIPDEVDEDSLTHQQLQAVSAVQCMEEEWILDPEIRKEMSCIDWT